MTIPREAWYLDTRRLGRRVLVFDRLESTNSLALSLANDPGADGLAILADEQSAGRGQHGRTWTAPPRAGVLLSVLLLAPPHLRRPVVLTAWTAVAVCAVIRQTTGLQGRIKWPNDVLLDGRKVCGILIEQARGPDAGLATVAGIGLNVCQTAAHFTEAGLPDATSLIQFTTSPLDTTHVARQLLHQLDSDYDSLCEGDLATLEASWKGHLGLLGGQVCAECHDATHHGRLRELSFDRVELERPGSPPLELRPEHIQHLNPE
jgi:BirA family biotin operon repressor/biotin-[acetyl-CoA-carboxylase] ligase